MLGRRLLVTFALVCGLLDGPTRLHAADDALAGASERLGWRAEYLQLDTRVVDGRARDSYRFVLVLKNLTKEAVTLTACESSWSLLTTGTDASTVSFQQTIAPGAELRVPFEAFLECFGGPGACRAPSGPHWIIRFSGRRASGEPVREVIDLTLPPRPGVKNVPLPALAIRRDEAAPAPAPGLVPLEPRNRLLIVHAKVQDQDLALALDTAAQLTVITPEAAARLGLGASAEVGRLPMIGIGAQPTDASILVIPSLRIGGYVVENLLVSVVPLFAGLVAVDGLLGADFMDAFTVTIDLKAKELRLQLAR